MTLTVMRRWSRLIAAVLLLAAARLPHIAADDPACIPGAAQARGEHDETAHVLQAGISDHGEHCAVCHWTRALRSLRTDVGAAAGCVDPASLLHGSRDDARFQPAFRNVPARAPPSELL